MSKLVNFLQDDLKEIDESFEHIKDIIEDKLHYSIIREDAVLINHIEKGSKRSVLNDVPFKQRLNNGGINLKGDILMIANSIVSKHQNGTTSNDNYSGSESNGLINMEYIDIDNDS